MEFGSKRKKNQKFNYKLEFPNIPQIPSIWGLKLAVITDIVGDQFPERPQYKGRCKNFFFSYNLEFIFSFYYIFHASCFLGFVVYIIIFF